MCLIDNLMKLKKRRKHEVLTGKLLQTNRVDLYLPFFYGIMKTHLINGGLKKWNIQRKLEIK